MSTPLPEIRRCAIYTRKSIAKGLDQEYNSLDAQADICMNYIRARADQGWVYVGTYVDAAVSGTTVEREQLSDLRRQVRARAVDCIVVYRLDRLSRDLADFTVLLKEFADNGVTFVSATQSIENGTPEGKLSMNMMAAVADYEAAVIRTRLKDKIAAARAQGRWAGGTPPYGYRAEKGKLRIDDRNALKVKLVFDLYATGNTIHDILVYLDSHGIEFTRRDGTSSTKWNSQTIRHMLENPLYAGYIRHHDTLYQGIHVPLIDADTYQAVRQKLEATKRGNDHARHNPVYPLRGILVCGKCGKLYTGKALVKNGVLVRYYQCLTSTSKNTVSCDNQKFNAEQLEQFLSEWMLNFRSNPQLAAALAAQFPEEDAGKIADCLFSLDVALRDAPLNEMQAVFHATFRSIVVNAESGQFDITLQDF